MKATFIRVVELWVPDKTRTQLEFGGGLCSARFSEFRSLSESALFSYNEGLPGKAWAAGHPVTHPQDFQLKEDRSQGFEQIGLAAAIGASAHEGRKAFGPGQFVLQAPFSAEVMLKITG